MDQKFTMKTLIVELSGGNHVLISEVYSARVEGGT